MRTSSAECASRKKFSLCGSRTMSRRKGHANLFDPVAAPYFGLRQLSGVGFGKLPRPLSFAHHAAGALLRPNWLTDRSRGFYAGVPAHSWSSPSHPANTR